MLSFTNLFFQNPHYSYIQEHLTPFISICIFPCFFIIYDSGQKIVVMTPNLQPSYVYIYASITSRYSPIQVLVSVKIFLNDDSLSLATIYHLLIQMLPMVPVDSIHES